MATNNDPDETDVLDLVIARHRVAAVMARDGLDPEEQAALDALDVPIAHVGMRVRIWGSLFSLMRNGLTRHTGDKAKDAGITVIVDVNRQMIDLVSADPVFI